MLGGPRTQVPVGDGAALWEPGTVDRSGEPERS